MNTNSRECSSDSRSFAVGRFYSFDWDWHHPDARRTRVDLWHGIYTVFTPEPPGFVLIRRPPRSQKTPPWSLQAIFSYFSDSTDSEPHRVIPNPLKPINMKSPTKLFFVAAALVSASSAFAATYQWDANGSTAGLGGTGTWDGTTNLVWDLVGTGADDGTDTTVAAVSAPNIIQLGGTAGTVTVSGGKTVGGIEVTTTGYTISGSSGVNFSGGGSLNTNAHNLNFAGFLSSNGTGKTITKDGSGTLTLGSANTGLTSANTFRINEGTVALNTNGTLGTINLAFNGGTLRSLNATTKSFANAISLVSTTNQTTLGASGSGAITLTGNVTVSTGANSITTTGAAALVVAASGTTLTLNAGILDLGSAFNTFNSGATGSYQLMSGTIAGTGFSSITGYDTNVWQSVSFTNGTLNFTAAAVPEPSTYGLMGAGALAAAAFVRRRRKTVA